MNTPQRPSTIVLATRHTDGTVDVQPFDDVDKAILEANRLGFSGGADVQRIGVGDATVKQAWVARTYDIKKYTASLRK